jgi:2-methylcitrate dehydratase PrpD
VTTYTDALKFCDRPAPGSVIEAKFSLQHSVAAALIFGEPALAHYEEATFARPDVRALAQRIEVAEAEPYAGRYPARYGARLEVTTASGGTCSFDAPDALGDPENPLKLEQLTGKARMLARSAGLSAEAADALVRDTLALSDGAPLDRFAASLAKPAEVR